jgi:bifunctional non-homologous end joining protein LigD
VIKDACQVRLYSRGGMDWTKRLASLAEALKGIPCRSGVIAAASSSCPPATARLISLARPRRYDHANPSLQCNAFDLLHRDGADLRPLPLAERRRRLERLLVRSDVPCLRLVECFDDGVKLLEGAERLQLEGIVSKRRAAPYRSSDCRGWVKVKTAHWRATNRERWRMFQS